MGMYTTLKFSAHLNSLGLTVVAMLNDRRDRWKAGERYDTALNDWGWVANELNLDWLHDWGQVGRADFIPFGGTSPDWACHKEGFMHPTGPSEWSPTSKTYLDQSTLDGSTWHVVCELKNYEGEIEKFLEELLPYLLAAPCAALWEYEEDSCRYDDDRDCWTVVDVLPKGVPE